MGPEGHGNKAAARNIVKTGVKMGVKMGEMLLTALAMLIRIRRIKGLALEGV